MSSIEIWRHTPVDHPLAVILGAVAAVAEARRVGLALELSIARLLGAQAALYTVLEIGERLLHGHPGTITGASVALGLLAPSQGVGAPRLGGPPRRGPPTNWH